MTLPKALEDWIVENIPLPTESDGIPKKREAWQWCYDKRDGARAAFEHMMPLVEALIESKGYEQYWHDDNGIPMNRITEMTDKALAKLGLDKEEG